jgi:hypothetical protein
MTALNTLPSALFELPGFLEAARAAINSPATQRAKAIRAVARVMATNGFDAEAVGLLKRGNRRGVHAVAGYATPNAKA